MKKITFLTLVGLMLMLINNSCEEVEGQSLISPEKSCYTILSEETVVDTFPIKQLQVDCPTGMKAFGAGWSVLDVTGVILDGEATYFQPSFDGSHWLTNAKSQAGSNRPWKIS